MRNKLGLVIVVAALVGAAWVSAAPGVRSGSTINATLVDCDGTIDCWLARTFVPSAWLNPRKTLVVERVTTVGEWSALPIATGEIGGNAIPPQGIALNLANAKVSSGTAVVPITIATDELSPDRYTGVVRLGGGDLETVEVPLDIRLRAGPLAALLWLLAGVLIGLAFKFWRERGQRLANSLNEIDRWTAIIAADSDANRKLLEPMLLEAREAKYRQQLDQLDAIIASIEVRRRMLGALDRLLIVLPASRRAEIDRIRSMILLRRDEQATAAIARLEGLTDRADTTGLESFGTPITSAKITKRRAPVSVPVPIAWWKLAWLWLAQHVVGRALRIVVIVGAVVMGLKVLYVDGGGTYGANPFFDGLALFIWGLGAEVSSRNLAELGKVLASRVTTSRVPDGLAKQGDEKRAKLPGDFVIRDRGGLESFDGAPGWPHTKLDLTVLSERGLEGDGVTVAVIDTGVERAQNQLDHDRIEATDLDGGDGDDDHGHGTCMIGILASDVGVAPKARVLSIQALDFEGNGSALDLARAVEMAVDRDCDVISISAGQPEIDSTLEAAVERATGKGIVVVAAIRKENPSALAYPASHDGVIAVTPSKRNERLRYPDPPEWVSIGAPGVDIPTYSLNTAASIEGASAATAIVAGVCARLLSSCTGPARRELGKRLGALLRSTGRTVDGGTLLQVLAAADKMKE